MFVSTLDSLKNFFETSPAAMKATRPLSREVEVALALEGGPARFTMHSGRAQVEAGAARDPDFTLTMTNGAVERITAIQGDDVGSFGIEFFKLIMEKDPSLKIKVKVEASTARLLGHGYLGVLALGGMKVTWWLLKNGVKNPKAAIDRLRGTA